MKLFAFQSRILNISIIGIIFYLIGCMLCFSENTTEIYPGKLIRYEIISNKSNPYIKVSLNEIINNNVSFKFMRYDRQLIGKKPIYEKMIVIRDKKDINDRGRHNLVHNEFIEGDIEQNSVDKEIGPIISEEVQYNGIFAKTNGNGILVDDQQLILSQFDELKHRLSTIQFSSDKFDNYEFELTRSDLYDLLGINFQNPKRSHPENLVYNAFWDKEQFSPGDKAILTVSIRHSGEDGNVSLVLSRTMSRWLWLDGKMFYFGDFKSEEKKTFSRIIKIPENIATGNYYLRIGIRDYSGAKLHLPLVIKIQS